MKTLYGSAVMAACLAAAHAASTATEETSNPLVSTALEFLARASSTSEVLTLNLTNLIILAILKAIILGFVIFSYGAGTNNAGYARSSDDVPSIKQSDLTGGMCFMMFTAGDEAKLSCVQRSACEDPKTATDYLTAAKMWHKMHKLMKVIPFSSEYVDIMTAVQEATDHSLKGGDCAVYRW